MSEKSNRHASDQAPGGCTHFALVQEVTPSGQGCQECLRTGEAWVHLRLCMTCGHVGCCDNSKNRHATKHFQETGHPVIRSFEPGEHWIWCFVDQAYLDS